MARAGWRSRSPARQRVFFFFFFAREKVTPFCFRGARSLRPSPPNLAQDKKLRRRSRSPPLSPTSPCPHSVSGCGPGGGRRYRSLEHEVMGGGGCSPQRPRRGFCVLRGTGPPSSPGGSPPAYPCQFWGAWTREPPERGGGVCRTTSLSEALTGAQPLPEPCPISKEAANPRSSSEAASRGSFCHLIAHL